MVKSRSISYLFILYSVYLYIPLLKGEEEETIEDVTVTEDIIDTEETLEGIEYKKKAKAQEPAEPEVSEPKFVYKLTDCHVKKHEEAVFELKLAKQKTKVRWSKDGVPISDDSKFKIEVDFFIHI